MELPTPQPQFERTTSKNPSVFSTPNSQLQKEAGMEKLKESIVKLCNTEPNRPLSTTQNSILQQRLNHFLSSLYNTPAPDHPPYAWMIQRALEELNEEGGTSEDSISKFITKEYDNLPWAHMTLLKHHLQKMSEDGEILMTDGGHFLLAGGDKSLNSKRKTKKKHLKRKRRWDSDIKQKKRRQKEKKKKECVKHDDVEDVKEQKFDEQQNEICEEQGELNLNGHHNELSLDKEDGLLNGRQNHVTGDEVLCTGVQRIRVKLKPQSDATEELLQSSIASESDFSNAGLVPVEPPRFMITEEIKHLKNLELQNKRLSLSGVEETTDICNLYPQVTLENEQPGDNLPQILSPEAPPGFEFIGVEDVTANKADNSASVGLDSSREDPVVHQRSEQPAEDQAPRTDDWSDASKQSKESLKPQGKQQHEGASLTSDLSVQSAPVLSLNQNQQQSLDSPKEDPVVHQSSVQPAEDQAPRTDYCSDASKQSKKRLKPQRKEQNEGGSLTNDLSAQSAPVLSVDQNQQQSLDSPKEDPVVHQSSEQPAEDQAPRTDDCSDASKQSKETLKLQRNQQHEGGSLTNESAQSAFVLSLNQNQQQRLDSPKEDPVVNQSSEQPAEDQAPRRDESERLEKEFAEDRLKTEKQQKSPHGWQQMKRSTRSSSKVQGEGTVTPNAPLLSDLQCQQQEQHISDRGSRQAQLALECSSEPKQQSILRKTTRSQLKAIITQEQEDSPETMERVDKHCCKKDFNEMIIPDIHGNLEKREVKQLKKPSKVEGPREIVLALGESSSKKQQQLEEWRSTPEKLNEDAEPDRLPLQGPEGFDAETIEKSSQTDRAQRQMKRWSRTRPEPKVGTRTTLHLATSEQVMKLTDPQHEMHLELRNRQLRRKPPQSKEDRAKLCTGTISAVETNEELCLDDPQHEVHLKQLRHKRLVRPTKRKEDSGQPGTTTLKNSGLSKKLKKN